MIALFSAIPVTMPGKAIGKMTRREIVWRPKKVAVDGEGRHRAEHERDRGGAQAGLQRVIRASGHPGCRLPDATTRG